MTVIDAAELGFAGIHVTISETELAWLYNIITNLAAQPIQDAITREVAAQVCALAVLCNPASNDLAVSRMKKHLVLLDEHHSHVYFDMKVQA